MNLPHSRRLFSLTMAVVATLAVPGQTKAQGNVRLVGFKAGVATSSTRPEAPDVPDGDGILTLTLGGYGRLPVGSRLAVQGELLFVRKGVDYPGLEARNSMLQVPLALQWLLPLDAVALRVFAGPAFALSLGCSPDETVVNVGFDDTPMLQTFPDCRMGRSGLHTSLVSGGLTDLSLGRTVVTLEVRYDLGLSRIEGRAFQDGLGATGLPDFEPYKGLVLTVGIGFPVRWRRNR